ncbi:hypothetical protein NP493_968g00004 [Ridgeia piscesae]|uniref:Ionotropic glutamate receptor L-glutamate and glycine-binding domain-containing protein n=1 Tax=Ridgeia piscesae TaxID=27915 RepID=A0AAD9KJ43_RIDPI|nr:hypothetical protein NP493_968g00004 [Ridgeia piscesae]
MSTPLQPSVVALSSISGTKGSSLSGIQSIPEDGCSSAQAEETCRIEVANLQPVTTCELVHDIEETVTDESSTDDENTTLMTRAEDVTGKPCCIVYEECLLKIAKMKTDAVCRRMADTESVSRRRVLMPEDPRRISRTLAPTTPPPTAELSFPYVMKDTDSSGVVKYKGFQIDMLKRVAEMANFDYTLFITPDNLYGTINKTTQTWNGMIGEIIAKLRHVCFHDALNVEELVDQYVPTEQMVRNTWISTTAAHRNCLPSPQTKSRLVMDAPPKSCNLDPAPTWLVKDTINELLPIVSHIVVTSLQSSVMPEKYKTSYISPLLKKTGLNPESLLNYRPISNLPFISKVIERVVAKQLTVYLQEHDLHDQFQSAYRKDHSTETALIKVHNDILCAVDRGCVVVLVMLDLTAALETIDHAILLSRLSQIWGHGRFA